MPIRQIPALIAELYATVKKLETLFPKRRFTLDGHLVGSIGEVVADYLYEIDLAPASTKSFDGKLRSSGKTVEIKLTAGERVNISYADGYADFLVVLKLLPFVGFSVIYAGPFPHQLMEKPNKSSRRFTSVSIGQLSKANCVTLDDCGRLQVLNDCFVAKVQDQS